MQPIGLLVWIYQAQFKKEKQEFVARKLDGRAEIKYLSISVLLVVGFGFIYQSIGNNRPYRDSTTDANQWGRGKSWQLSFTVNSGYSGQLLMSFQSISGGEKACKFKGNTWLSH